MAEQGSLKKRLGFIELVFLGLGAIIGSGWLFASQTGAQMAGANAWMAWVFGAIAVMLIGLVFAELGAAIPRAGGFVRYPEYTHGSLTGFIAGFTSMLAYSSVAGIEVEAVRGYAVHWWPALGDKLGNPTIVGYMLQIALLVLFFLANYWSVNFFAKVNSYVTAIKFIVPAITIIVLLANLKVSNFTVTGASPGGANGIASAIASGGIVFAFLGFRQAIDFSAEAKNPQRDVPLAIITSIALGAVIYILLQIAFIGAVPHSMLTHGWAHVSISSPFAGLAGALGLGWMANILFADAVLSPTGTGNIYLAGTTRVLFAWAKNGHFYSMFQKVDARTGIPRGALWLSFVLSIIWTLPVHFKVWSGLVGAVTSATVMTYMLGPISFGSLRRFAPGMKRPFRLPGASIISPLAFIVASEIIYWTGWTIDSLLIGLTLGSLVLYFAFMDRDAESRRQIKIGWKSGAWLVVYYILIGIMSYLGSFGPLKSPAFQWPWDSVIVAVIAIGIYYWGVASGLRSPVFTTDESEVADVASAVSAGL